MDTNRSNIIKLVPAKKQKQTKQIADQENQKSNTTKTAFNGKVIAMKAGYFAGMGVLNILRYTLFFMMQILRGPIRIFCGLFTFAAMLAIPGIMIGVPSGHEFKYPALFFLIAGLLFCSALVWFYDSLLLKMAPGQMFLTN